MHKLVKLIAKLIKKLNKTVSLIELGTNIIKSSYIQP